MSDTFETKHYDLATWAVAQGRRKLADQRAADTEQNP